MISNYKIYQPNQKLLSKYNLSEELYIDFEIDLNGNVIQLKLVELKDLIALLIVISNSTYRIDSHIDSFKLSGDKTYFFKWSRENKVSTYYLFSIFSDNSKVISTKVWTGNLSYYNFYINLINELINLKLFDLAKKYGNLFYNSNSTHYKYRIADKVKTTINKNVKTERIGFIIDKFEHVNEKSNMYHLLINGKVYKKRYFERDLEIVNEE